MTCKAHVYVISQELTFLCHWLFVISVVNHSLIEVIFKICLFDWVNITSFDRCITDHYSFFLIWTCQCTNTHSRPRQTSTMQCTLHATCSQSFMMDVSICYGAAQRRHNLFCWIHEIIFKFYLWCLDDFPTDWLDDLYKINRWGLQVLLFVKALPVSLCFVNVSSIIGLLQVGLVLLLRS